MNCKSHVTEQADGTAPAVHCRSCNVRRRLQPGEVFACPSGHHIQCGPGCQLRKTLSWFVRDDGKCGCTEYAAQMDAWGPDGCFRRIEEIVEHLRGAAEKKGLPFIATAARIMVGRAIEAARAAATPPPG